MSAQIAGLGTVAIRIFCIARTAVRSSRRRPNENDSFGDCVDDCDSRICKGEFVVADLNILVSCGNVLVQKQIGGFYG